MIDSKLEKFFRNGNHDTVTRSDTSVRATVKAKAVRGKRTHEARRAASSVSEIPR